MTEIEAAFPEKGFQLSLRHGFYGQFRFEQILDVEHGMGSIDKR